MSDIEAQVTFYRQVLIGTVIVIWVISGVFASSIYGRKGRSGLLGFLAGFLLGPLGVLIATLTSPDRAHLRRQALQAGLLRECPHCYEVIDSRATVCPNCSRDVPKYVKPLPDAGLPETPSQSVRTTPPQESNFPLVPILLGVVALLLCVLVFAGTIALRRYQARSEALFEAISWCVTINMGNDRPTDECGAWATEYLDTHQGKLQECTDKWYLGGINVDRDTFIACMGGGDDGIISSVPDF